jgi:hypothetical protein
MKPTLLFTLSALATSLFANPLPDPLANAAKRDVITYTTSWTYSYTYPTTTTEVRTYTLSKTVWATPTAVPTSTCGNLLINPNFAYDINPSNDWTGTLLSGLSVTKTNSYTYPGMTSRVFLLLVDSSAWYPIPVEYKLRQGLRYNNANCGYGSGERYRISTQIRSQHQCNFKVTYNGVELSSTDFSSAAGNLSTWVPLSYEVEPVGDGEMLEFRFYCGVNQSSGSVNAHMFLAEVVVEKL